MINLTVKQAAERLGVSPSLVYALIAARKLRHVRIGNGRGIIRIEDDAVSEYLARCTFEPVGGKPKPVTGPRKLRHLKLD